MEQIQHFRHPKHKTFQKHHDVPLYKMTKDEAKRFCLETGLHGFQYIAKKDNTPTERFIWTFISFGALITALTLSFMSLTYSISFPTLIVTDSMQEPISNFIFPAISICSLNKISKQLAVKFLNETLKVSDINIGMEEIKDLANLYFGNVENFVFKNYNEFQHLFITHGITVEQALVAITEDCQGFVKSCLWKGRKIRCDRLFQMTRTPQGICCTFNHFAFRNRSFEGFMADRYKPYPRKVVSCGHSSGIQVLVNNKPNDYLVSELSAYGSQILIHDPYEYPDWSAQRVLLSMGTQIYVDINPTRTYTSDSVQALSTKKRQCVYKTERTLKIFNNYTYLNCMTECRIKILGNVCGCLPLYYRNEWFQWTPNLRICDLKDVPCINTNKQRFMSVVPGYDTYQTRSKDHIWGSEIPDCDCMQDCTPQVNIVQSTMGRLSIREIVNNKQLFGDIQNINDYNLISIFFKDLSGTRNHRDVTFMWFTIFGLFGGLLGLCLGFTLIAVVDVIYTFSLRLGINVWRWKKNSAQIKQTPFQIKDFQVLPLVNEPLKSNKYSDKKMYKNSLNNDIWYIN